MGQLKRLSLFVVIFIGLLFPQKGISKEDRRIYSRVKQFVKDGNIDFAYMGCQNILDNYQNSRYREKCLFAKGEYFFSLPNYNESKDFFLEYAKIFPASKGKLFALAYLHKISLMAHDYGSAEEYKNAIINSQQLGLIFKSKHKQTYKSILGTIHDVVITINKIEFYVKGEIFTTFSY